MATAPTPAPAGGPTIRIQMPEIEMHQPVRTVVSPANQQQASHGTEGNQAEQTKGANMARYALIGFIALLAAIFLYQVTGRMLDHLFPKEKERVVYTPPPRNTPRP